MKDRERLRLESLSTTNKSQDLEKTRELLTEAKESEQELDELVEKNRRMLASEEDDDLYEGEELQQVCTVPVYHMSLFGSQCICD